MERSNASAVPLGKIRSSWEIRYSQTARKARPSQPRGGGILRAGTGAIVMKRYLATGHEPWYGSMLAVHRPVLLDLRRIAGHVLEDVHREDDVQGNQSELPL